MQGRRDRLVAQRQHHLHHTTHTGGALRMADIRLQRPQPHPATLATPVGRQQRLRLDRIPQPGPGAVAFHHVDVLHRQPTRRQRIPNDPLLRATVRCCQAVRRTILIHRRTPHHRQHPPTSPPSIRQPLQQQNTDPLTPAGAIRGLAVGLATAIRRQPTLPTELQKLARTRHHGGAPDERQRALARPQRPRPEVQRDQ